MRNVYAHAHQDIKKTEFHTNLDLNRKSILGIANYWVKEYAKTIGAEFKPQWATGKVIPNKEWKRICKLFNIN